MIIYNENTITSLFEENSDFRRCAMATTVFTPKLMTLLDKIQLDYQLKNFDIRELQQKCQKYMHTSFSDFSCKSKTFKCEHLYTASKLYFLLDDVLVAASIEEKIVSWKTILMIIYRQDDAAPIQVSLTPIPKSNAEYCALNTTQIKEELYNYADEIDAWIELYFDDYDDFSDEPDMRYDDLISIISSIKSLAECLS